jgi:hypothetical protein
MLICFLLFMGIHSKTRKIITHNRQVPCSSQGGATIFLVLLIELPHTRRLIDFGSHWNLSEKPLLANFVLTQPLRDFDLCPSPTYLDCKILPQRTTAELSEWGLYWILDNCKPVAVSGGDRRIWRSVMVAGLNSAVACFISWASPKCQNPT